MRGIVKSLGLVFGDIGTSPIYTLTVVFLIIKPTEANILGVLSLIVWTLIVLVSIEYAWLAMSLGKKGEGGTIVLTEILVSLLKSAKLKNFVIFLSFIGISLLIGDGVITPAISILSAVEGIPLIPGLGYLGSKEFIIIASCIALVLFAIQRKGTEKIAGFFGPVMVVWFTALAVTGIASISACPVVLKAVNPFYGIDFLLHHGLAGFFILSEVVLCATGGEALYADMGHLGRKPIMRAWYYVAFPALILSYLGQGAFLLNHPEVKNVLFGMVHSLLSGFYAPFLVLSIAATVIASQAMISGIFSIVYQGIMTDVMPPLKVDYTSDKLRSQIYIGSVNWFLLIAVLFVMYEFKSSEHLAAAYGLAVTGTMTLTGIMMTAIFYHRGSRYKAALSLLVAVVNVIFFVSSSYKIPHGGYWSIILALFPFLLIILYLEGQKRLYKKLDRMDQGTFIKNYKVLWDGTVKIPGTALYFVRYTDKIHPYIIQTMFTNNIIYENNILLNIIRRSDPFGYVGYCKEFLAEGLTIFEIQTGYMEVLDVDKILRESGIDEKAIFYGIEDIVTHNILWGAFAFLKQNTPRFVQFYKLPSFKLHGVITRVQM